MADYITLPRVIDNDFMTYGETAFSVRSLGLYKVGYESEQSNSIRMAVYRTADRVNFIFASSGEISSINIGMYSPYGTRVGHLSAIDIAFDGGYYSGFAYTTDNMSFDINVFSSLQEALTAVSYGSQPSPTSGVVVTIIGSPDSTPPSTEGVVVYVTGRVLDPNQQGGTSNPGGGQGTFDETSDPIPIPPLPDISAADAGMITLFSPTQSELKELGAYLWTNLSDFIDNLNKLFANPMDYIISLNIFPCQPDLLAARDINIGSFTTNIQMAPVASQWFEYNCGSVRLNEYWGSALDYAPNTKVSLMLPFIGSVPLNTDEVMGHEIGVKYHIDLLSGSCVAMVTIDGNVYYQYTGECSVNIPLTGSDWSRVYAAVTGAVGTAITGGIAAAGVGASAGAATAALAHGTAKSAYSAGFAANSLAKFNEAMAGKKGVQAGRQALIEAMSASADAAKNAATASGNVSSGLRTARLAGTINNTMSQVMGAKAGVSHSGSISGAAGMLGVKVPYLLIEYPNQSLADNYKHYVGYPSNMEAMLGNLSGYSEVEQVIPDGFTGTDDELGELVDALKGGVYL